MVYGWDKATIFLALFKRKTIITLQGIQLGLCFIHQWYSNGFDGILDAAGGADQMTIYLGYI